MSSKIKLPKKAHQFYLEEIRISEPGKVTQGNILKIMLRFKRLPKEIRERFLKMENDDRERYSIAMKARTLNPLSIQKITLLKGSKKGELFWEKSWIDRDKLCVQYTLSTDRARFLINRWWIGSVDIKELDSNLFKTKVIMESNPLKYTVNHFCTNPDDDKLTDRFIKIMSVKG